MRRIALFALLLTFTATLAGELTTEEVVTRVKASYAAARTFTCDVRRVTASGMLGQRHVMRGTMLSLLPDSFRIDYVSPFEQSLVCNGETVWLYTPRNNQVIVSSVDDYAEREMLGDLIGYFERDYGCSALYAHKDVVIDASALPLDSHKPVLLAPLTQLVDLQITQFGSS